MTYNSFAELAQKQADMPKDATANDENKEAAGTPQVENTGKKDNKRDDYYKIYVPFDEKKERY